MLSILKKNQTASFGFMGAHTINLAERFEEQRSNTKRFRIYKYAIEELIGTESFTHFMNEENSTYLLVNNKVESIDLLSANADNMFIDIYPQLAGI